MNSRTIVLAAAALLAAASAQAQTLEVIYCEIPTSPKSVVPGALDETTNLPEASNWRALEDIFVSPDGSTWMAKGRTQQGANEELIMIKGSGLAGTMFAQEGQPVHAGAPGEVYEFFGSTVGRFNSLNQFAYSARARGGVAAVFQKVIFWNGATFSMPTQMGDLYTGLIDQAPNPVGDEIVGNSIGSIHLLDDGRIGAHDTTIGNIHSSKRPAIFYDRAMFKQVENSNFLDYAGVNNVQVDNLSSGTFWTTPDGAHWIVEVDLDMTVTSRNATVYDGKVMLEPAQLIPATAVVVGDVFASNIAHNGDWFARGRDNSGSTTAAPDWATRNATLIAKSGDSVEGGAELYGDTFYAFTGNGVGDWVLCANTNNANVLLNEVVVWNGAIVLREGDPVDVDGNGLFDDNAFIGRASLTTAVFQANDFVLTDDNVLYFLATLKDGAGVDLGSAPVFGGPDVLLRIDLDGSCGTMTNYCTAGTTTNNCTPTMSGAGVPSATAPSGFVLTANNLEGLKQTIMFYGVTGQAAGPWGTSTSFLCVKAPTQRMPAQTASGTVNACDGFVSIDWNAYITTHPLALGVPFSAGQVVNAQAWFRDPPSPKTTNLTDGIEFVVCP